MAGRRRRASTSSVDSIDDGQLRWRQESSVVRSVPSDLPSDDWPIFELRDAVILHRDGTSLENALQVDFRGPYLVRGHLVIEEPSQKTHLIMRVRRSVPLEIRHCFSYSIGETENGSPIIWVSGQGGWYEISPSAAYRPVYRKMCEATTLYYKLVDIYNSTPTPKKAKKQKHSTLMDELSGVLLQYAARVGDGSTLDEVAARCNEHAGFLLSHFAQRETLIDWAPTAFYRWLVSEHADLVRTIRDSISNPRGQSLNNPSIKMRSPALRGSAASSPLLKMEEVDDRAVSSRRGSRAASTRIHSAAAPAAPKISPSPVSPPDKQSPKYPTQPDTAARDDSPLSSVLDAMEAAYGALKDSKRGLTTTSVLNHIYFAYSFPQYRDGTTGSFKIPVQEVLHYNAAALLQSLDPSKYQGHEIYAFLERLAKTELTLVAYKPSDFPVRLAHRKRVQRQSKKDLLPPPAPAGRTATAHDQRNYDDAASDGTPPAGRGKSLKHEGRRTGKKSFLRPVVTNRKRPHSQLECDSDADAPEPDPSGSHYFDDTMEDAPDAETPRDGHSSDSDQPSSRHETPIKIVIRAEKMPSATPQGPDDTWACEHEGCGYVVRGGDDECQARIRAHFDDHEQQLERVSLAVTESRGHLTINHLLDKIKRMGERSAQRTMDGLLVPQPIKRKLLV